jgi:ATP-dependent DNA helicase 2 subunit 2
MTSFGCFLAIDALIVGIETQARYLAKKPTWTRKAVLVTDAESPIEVEDWEATVKKMDSLNINLTVMYAASVEISSVNLIVE